AHTLTGGPRAADILRWPRSCHSPQHSATTPDSQAGSARSPHSRSDPVPHRDPSSPPPDRAPHVATLKFLVVVLAAGMLAFLGAVICIIAAVHPGFASSAAAAPAAAPPDNDSLSRDSLLQPLPEGSVGALEAQSPVQNQSGIGEKGLGVVSGTGGDPEGELGHRHELEEGIDTLQQRIAELEQGLSEQTYPEGYKLSFPVRTDYMYGVVRHPIPELYAFTTCLWLRTKDGGIGTPFSYAVPDQPNELVLLRGVHNPVELLVNDRVGGPRVLFAGSRFSPPWVLVLGQEQDAMGGRFDASQALVGELSQFNLWDRVLSPAEIAGLADCSAAFLGNVVPWTDRGVGVFGGAAKESPEACREPAGARK
ncbi:hypothetical protein Z043_125941, partial [Scleropages formosus]